MYDPTIGRWLSEDPRGYAAGDYNLYRYVHNAPTNNTDPSGLLDQSTFEEILQKHDPSLYDFWRIQKQGVLIYRRPGLLGLIGDTGFKSQFFGGPLKIWIHADASDEQAIAYITKTVEQTYGSSFYYFAINRALDNAIHGVGGQSKKDEIKRALVLGGDYWEKERHAIRRSLEGDDRAWLSLSDESKKQVLDKMRLSAELKQRLGAAWKTVTRQRDPRDIVMQFSPGELLSLLVQISKEQETREQLKKDPAAKLFGPEDMRAFIKESRTAFEKSATSLTPVQSKGLAPWLYGDETFFKPGLEYNARNELVIGFLPTQRLKDLQLAQALAKTTHLSGSNFYYFRVGQLRIPLASAEAMVWYSHFGSKLPTVYMTPEQGLVSDTAPLEIVANVGAAVLTGGASVPLVSAAKAGLKALAADAAFRLASYGIDKATGQEGTGDKVILGLMVSLLARQRFSSWRLNRLAKQEAVAAERELTAAKKAAVAAEPAPKEPHGSTAPLDKALGRLQGKTVPAGELKVVSESELTLGGQKHTLRVVVADGQFRLVLCSDPCQKLIDGIDKVLKELRKHSDTRTGLVEQLKRQKDRAEALQKDVAKDKISGSKLDEGLAEIGLELQDIGRQVPNELKAIFDFAKEGQLAPKVSHLPGYDALPAKGNPIGSGGEGTVFELPGHPDWVLKEFNPGTVRMQASNEANHLAELAKVFGEDHVVKTITPPRRFAPGEPVVLLKEKITVVSTGQDVAALAAIRRTLMEKGITADVGNNLVWGTTTGNLTPRWIWIE